MHRGLVKFGGHKSISSLSFCFNCVFSVAGESLSPPVDSGDILGTLRNAVSSLFFKLFIC